MKIKLLRLLPVLLVQLFLVCAVFQAPPVLAGEPNARANRAPNVVMFFIDDLGYTDLGCYGSTFHETPVIDQLASQSVRFNDFYSANPVCSPTRVALMTGKAPHRLGITQWLNQPNELHLPLEEVTIGEALSEAGYQTGYIGKWHLGDKDMHMPQAQGFDWVRCVNRGGSPGSYFYPYRRSGNKNKPNGIRFWDVPDLGNGKKGDYLNDAMTDQALSFIKENQKQPFFLCFAHYAVHTPIQAPDALVDKYQAKLRSGDEQPQDVIAERNGARTRSSQNNPTYAAMLENLDTNVGRVLQEIKDLSLRENTIIVFTSDNGGLSTLASRRSSGGPTCCLPLRAGKGWTYEGGIRIPTMVSWPGHLKPAESSVPGITMDLYPTILDLVGVGLKPKQHLDGISLVPVLKGSAGAEFKNRPLAWTYPHNHGSGHSPSNAIRMGKWKLIQLTDDKTETKDRYELYDLQADVGESENLAIKHYEKTHQMAKRLSEWLESTLPEKPPRE